FVLHFGVNPWTTVLTANKTEECFFDQQNLSRNELHVSIPKRLLESTKRIGYTKVIISYKGTDILLSVPWVTLSLLFWVVSFFFLIKGWFPLRDFYSASTSPIGVFRLT
ncbi:unnamed protein product, partial [Arabidopsis halleri]